MAKRSSTTVAPRAEAKRVAQAVQQRPSLAVDRVAEIKRAADCVAEASCLVAVLSVPLCFSVLTSTGYESDKAILLRVFAAIAAAAWMVGFALERPRSWAVRRDNLLVWVGVLVFALYTLATILSIDPRVSLWGSQGRQQGLWTHAAYLVFFIIAATRLRSPAQWRRLVTVLLFGSVTVVVYGFFQQFHLDPIPNGGDPTTLAWPVRSTLGQHVFLGAYLVMVIPFTAVRVIENWNWRAAPEDKRGGDWALLMGGAALFAVLTFYIFLGAGFHVGNLYQGPVLFALFPAVLGGYVLVGLLLEEMPDTRSARQVRRAGYAALLAAQILVLVMTGARGPWLGFFASLPVFGFLLARRLERPQIAGAILAVTAAIALFVGVLNIPGGPLQPMRTVHGLSRVANLTDSAGSDGSAQGRLLIWQGVKNLMTENPSVGGTWGGAGRALVGYGPETLHWAFEAVYPRLLRQATSETWAWDRSHDIYLDYLVDAGVLGLLAVLAAVALFFWKMLAWLRSSDNMIVWLVIAGATAMAGHLVEGIFGIETAVTLLLFWLLLGFAARLPLARDEETPQPARQSSLVPTAIWYWVALMVVLGVVAALSVSAANHPAVLSALWLLACLAAVGGVAAALKGPTVQAAVSRTAQRQADGKRTEVAASALPGRALITGGLIALAGVLALGSQMRFETAAFAERLGQTQLAELNQSSGIGYLEEAVNNNAYEPVYATELGAAYLSIGTNHVDSANPAYVPSAQAFRTLDPQQALNLGRDQLYTLAEESLQAARSDAPLDPDMYNNLGNLYLQWNRPVEALTVFRRAQALSANSPKYLDQEALAELQAGHAAYGRTLAEAGLQLDPTYWFTYYALAQLDHQLGAHAQAKNEARIALVTKANAYPPPPPQQVQQLQSIQRSG